MATSISHCLKVQSRWFKNYIFAKKVYFDQLLDLQYIAFIIPSHFISVPCFTLWMLDFSISSGCQTVWMQSRPDNLPDLGPNCFQWLSTDNKSTSSGQKVNTKQLVDTTFWLKPWLKLISLSSNFSHWTKVLATAKSEPE